MTKKEEYELMKNNPLALYNYYLDMLLDGQHLTDEQIVKFEYLKKILLIQE